MCKKEETKKKKKKKKTTIGSTDRQVYLSYLSGARKRTRKKNRKRQKSSPPSQDSLHKLWSGAIPQENMYVHTPPILPRNKLSTPLPPFPIPPLLRSNRHSRPLRSTDKLWNRRGSANVDRKNTRFWPWPALSLREPWTKPATR